MLITRNTEDEVALQVISYDGMSKHGSLPQIHGKITTSDEKLTIKEQRVGSSGVKNSRNGNHHPVPFCGFTENVCMSDSI